MSIISCTIRPTAYILATSALALALLAGCGKDDSAETADTTAALAEASGAVTDAAGAETDTADASNTEMTGADSEDTTTTEDDAEGSSSNYLWETIPGAAPKEETVDSNSAVDENSLWDEIPGEDTWGPFPDGDEISLSYAYNQLDSNEQLVYAELRRMIRTREETNLSTLDADEVREIYDMVLADHPEIFYVDGYTITSHTRNGALEYLSASANYVYDAEQTAEYERLIDTAVDSILLQAPTDGSDYDKVKFCYEYLIRNTDYDLSAENNQNIISVFLNHASVCNGYAKAFQYLLLKMDVATTLVSGTASSQTASGPHAWDLVRIDGQYYYCDPTWGDPQYAGSTTTSLEASISYDYLNVTTADMQASHTAGDTIPLPVCTDTTYNYYIQEGLYFAGYDAAQLHRIANAAYEDGSLVIRFRCADANVYNEMRAALIDNKEIYNYLYQANGVSYTSSDSLYTMSIVIK